MTTHHTNDQHALLAATLDALREAEAALIGPSDEFEGCAEALAKVRAVHQRQKSSATVAIKDRLVCITVRAPGQPDAELRMPANLARKIARLLLEAADKAPAPLTLVAPSGAQEGGDA
ncbi:hypothetical protein ACFSDD_11245 [Salipiger marinus]|uniref:hypothetical protein n=1 Tax=Salipiger marinus TaxID=555512 RepID=UPI002BBAE0F8|nr:hypothetical protein [Salipiger manganoxidans]MEB3419947.1 hypothetical protein [Salipiger manganoxidans]